MSKLFLLLLFCVVLFKANPQAGNLDSAFGKNGIQMTAFFSKPNSLNEQGRVVLTSINGDIFVVARHTFYPWYTRIVKYSPDGKLDSSYGNAGYSTTATLNVASAVMQGDKIVVAGSISNEGIGDDFGLARYMPDGSLDASFGVNGVVKTNFNTDYDEGANAVALQGNKIVVAGFTYTYASYTDDIIVARYTTDGTLDSSFGTDGKVITDFNKSDDRANAMVLLGDTIIVAGYSSRFLSSNSYDFAVARYTPDGKLDSSFGKNGKVKTDFNNSDDRANAMALRGDKILVVGYTYNSDYIPDFALVCYTADGTLDSAFGKNGKVKTDFNSSSYDQAFAIALRQDKILLAGTSDSDIALACYTAGGALDLGFGNNGKVITDFKNTEDHANSIAMQGGKILIGGTVFYYDNYSPSDFAVARYKADGSLDVSFGKKGKLTGYFPATRLFFTSIAMQGDKIIAAGYTNPKYDEFDFALARYSHDGTLDSSFGVNGRVITDFHKPGQTASSVALQGNKIIVTGYIGDNFNGFKFVLARYTADGILDSSFGKNGKVTTGFINTFLLERPNSIAIQGSRILVAGYAYNEDNFTTDFALVRYNADGDLDSAFGKNGTVLTDFNNVYDQANSIALQGDKIIMGGYTSNIFASQDFALARYTADGKLDASFGQNGIVATDFNNADDQVKSIALQGDKIIVKGNTGHIFDSIDVVLVRYTADGTLDTSFGENGKVTTDFTSAYNRGSSIAIQGDKVIVAGQIGDNDFSFARYTANGSLDSSFGKNGKVTTDLTGIAGLGEIVQYNNHFYAAGSLTFGADEIYGVIAAYRLEAPVPAITIKDITVSESRKVAVATVRLSAPATQRVIVHFITRDKTAIHSQDYINVSYPLLFLPGFNTTAKIFIPIVDDNKAEGKEQFGIVLTNALHATIQDSIALVTILDDDDAVITKQDDPLMAGQEASLHINASPNPYISATTIQLRGGNNKQPVSVRVYDVSGRVIEERKDISVGQSLRLGDQYKAGIYIIEAVQGGQSVQAKVIKSGK